MFTGAFGDVRPPLSPSRADEESVEWWWCDLLPLPLSLSLT